MKYKVAIDDGHGADTPGKRTPYISTLGRSVHENEFNSACASYLAKALARCKIAHVLTTTDSSDLPLKDRVKTANTAKADVFVSIHYNAYTDKFNSVSGIETWYYGPTTCGGDKLAKYVQDALVAVTGKKDRGIKPASNQFYVIKYTTMPAILVECGFMTNKADAADMLNKDYQKICAESICKGICKFLKVDYVPLETKSSSNTETKELIEELRQDMLDLFCTTESYKDAFDDYKKSIGEKLSKIESLL